MNKKILILIVALITSMAAPSITAQEPQSKPQETAVSKAENAGFKKGIAATLAASSIAMIMYINSTLKQGLFIPAQINCRSIPDGYRWECPTNVTHPRFGATCHKVPAFKTVCENNPLFQAMRDVSGDVSMQGASINKDFSLKAMLDASSTNSVSINVQENMLEKISGFPNTVAYACVATLFGTFIYYLSLDYKSQKSVDATNKKTLEQPALEQI